MKKEHVKIGTILTVRDDLKLGNTYGNNSFTGNMHLLLGKKVQVTKGCAGAGFRIIEDREYLSWTWEMFKESQVQSKEQPKKQETKINSLVQRVLLNDKATIVFFTDGTKSVVVHNDDLPYDSEKAIAMAIAKKFMGGYTELKKVVDSVDVKDSKRFARVIDYGQTYTTYPNFFNEHNKLEYKDDYTNEVLTNGEVVEVLYEGKHNNKETKLAIVRRNDTSIGLIGANGLKFL